MADSYSTGIDLIHELRLRRWARRNYVPADQRSDESWNPIVLDEMRLKDAELQKTSLHQPMTSSCVPLAPVMMDFHGVHQAHQEQIKPKLVDSTWEQGIRIYG